MAFTFDCVISDTDLLITTILQDDDNIVGTLTDIEALAVYLDGTVPSFSVGVPTKIAGTVGTYKSQITGLNFASNRKGLMLEVYVTIGGTTYTFSKFMAPNTFVRDTRDFAQVNHIFRYRSRDLNSVKCGPLLVMVPGEKKRVGFMCNHPQLMPTGAFIDQQISTGLVVANSNVTLLPLGHDGQMAKFEVTVSSSATSALVVLEQIVSTSLGSDVLKLYGDLKIETLV